MEVAILTALCPILTNAYCDLSTSFPWQPSWMPLRDDLYCTSACDQYYGPNYQGNSTYDKKDECCTCNSCTSWEGSLNDLFIEMVTVTGKSIVLIDEAYNHTSDFQIESTEGEMTELPSNLCNWDNDSRINSSYGNHFHDIQIYWPRIFQIDFSGNSIRKIVDLNCLEKLDTLILNFNKIQYITNSSMSNLPYLRELDISNNNILDMDPTVLFSPNINVFFANFSNNEISTGKVSNLFLQNPFCRLDFSNNKIESLVNTIGFELDLSQNYGPGLVLLNNNLVTKFPDLKTLLNMDSLSHWGKLIHSGFDLRGIQLDCDCNLEPFIQLTENIRELLFQDYLNVSCSWPDWLKGRSVFSLQPEELVCELEVDSGCPKLCHCLDQPSFNTLYVDCSNANFRNMPKTLPVSPFSEYISLNLMGNQIRKIDLDAPYLNKLSMLDVSDNDLESLSDDVANVLENTTLILSGNYPLRKLPRSFQYRNSCSLYTSNLEIDCGCETLWIESWMQTKHKYCNHTQYFTCKVPEKGVILAKNFRSSLLQCGPDESALQTLLYALIAALVFLLIVLIAIIVFRYEILVICLRLRQHSIKRPVCGFMYDVFIIIDEEDDKLRAWVIKELYPKLEAQGYRMFFPARDVPYGDERDSKIATTMQSSRNALLILSDGFLKEPDETEIGGICKKNEWKYAWHQFKKDSKKNIVIVNYDHISSFCVNQGQIRAFLRVGHTVDFGNYKNDVLQKIMLKLGPPPISKYIHGNGNNNCKLVLHRPDRKKDDFDIQNQKKPPNEEYLELHFKDSVGKPKFRQEFLRTVFPLLEHHLPHRGDQSHKPRIPLGFLQPSTPNHLPDNTSVDDLDIDSQVPLGATTAKPYSKRPVKIHNSKVEPQQKCDEISLKSFEFIQHLFLTETSV